MKHTIFASLTLAVFVGLAGAAQAQDGCAVAAVNGKATAAAGSVDAGGSEETYELGLSATAPIGCAFGVQADVQASKFGSSEQYGGQAHIFTRKPSRYLLGVTAGYIDGDSTPSASFAAVEGEYYTEKFTVLAMAGAAHSSPIASEGLGYLAVSYYPTSNLKLTVSNLRAFDNDLTAVRAEWQPANSRFSVFAEAQTDPSPTDLTLFKIGGRVYFGSGSKSLKERNRQDDPEAALYSFGLNYNLTLAQVQILQPGPGSGGTGQNPGGLGPNGRPIPVNGVCPAGFFYVPSLSTTECFL